MSEKINIPNPHVNTPCDQRLIMPRYGLTSLASTSLSSKLLDDDVSSWNVSLLTCRDENDGVNLEHVSLTVEQNQLKINNQNENHAGPVTG